MTGTEQEFVTHVQQTRYMSAALLLALLWTIESVAPMFPGRRRRMSHNATNLSLALLNAVVAFGFAFGILFVTEFAEERGFGLLHLIALPTWLSWVLAIVLLDCWQYWWHRMNHRFGFLWRFHAVHCTPTFPGTSASRKPGLRKQFTGSQ